MRGRNTFLPLAALMLASICPAVFCETTTPDPGWALPWGYETACKDATPEVWHLPYPGDCTKFIKCDYIGKIAKGYTCWTPLHFNPSIQTCDWPESAGCKDGGGSVGDTTTTSVDTTTSSAEPITTASSTSNPGSSSTAGWTSTPDPGWPLPWDYNTACKDATPEVWHLPYPGDCTKFIKCDYIGKIAKGYTCWTPLHFNPNIQTCDWPESAGCKDGGGSGGDTTTPSVGTTTPPPEPSPTPEPATTGWPITTEEPSTTVKPTTTEEPTTTEVPTIVSSTTSSPLCPSTINPGTEPTLNPSGNNCAKPYGPDNVCGPAYNPDNWILADPTSRRYFYKCEVNSCRAFRYICPGALVFNPVLRVCDWA